jgi:hypothetical protein
MAEDSTDQVDDTQTDATTDQSATDDLGDTGKKALDNERAARKESDRKFKVLEKEMEKVRSASMSEAEKAISEAEARGLKTGRAEGGTRLARTEFDALAGRRNPDFDTASALEYIDLSRFVGEDGEPDATAIKAAVERLVPVPAGGPPSFDGGARTSASAKGDMNKIIRQAAGLG